MPYLNLGDWKDTLDVSGTVRLFGKMAFPNDSEKEKQFIAVSLVDHEEDFINGMISRHKAIYKDSLSNNELKKISSDIRKGMASAIEKAYIEAGGKTALLNAPSCKDVAKEYKKVQLKGQTAGTILLYIMMTNFSSNSPKKGKGSVNKSVEIIETNEKYLRENKVPFNASDAKKQWSEYKSVSHLWAAFVLWSNHIQNEKCSPHSFEGLRGFLAISEYFRKQGEALIPHGQKTPLLLPGTTWVAPDGLIDVEVTFELPPFEQWELNALNKYKAPI